MHPSDDWTYKIGLTLISLKLDFKMVRQSKMRTGKPNLKNVIWGRWVPKNLPMPQAHLIIVSKTVIKFLSKRL
jgi:hypothetical protein